MYSSVTARVAAKWNHLMGLCGTIDTFLGCGEMKSQLHPERDAICVFIVLGRFAAMAQVAWSLRSRPLLVCDITVARMHQRSETIQPAKSRKGGSNKC